MGDSLTAKDKETIVYALKEVLSRCALPKTSSLYKDLTKTLDKFQK